jgi:hypothetical protein
VTAGYLDGAQVDHVWRRLLELADVELIDSAIIRDDDGAVLLELELAGLVVYRVTIGNLVVVVHVPAELAGSRAAQYVVLRRVIDQARDAGATLGPFLDELQPAA